MIEMKKILRLMALAMGLCFADVQPSLAASTVDTCFVGVCIDNPAEPFIVQSDAQGRKLGVVEKNSQGKSVLYTNCPFIKVLNVSTDEVRDKNTHVYRLITFNKGEATTYDYKRQQAGQPRVFSPVKVRNMTNMIYFRVDSAKVANLYFRLEGMESYQRDLQVRYADSAAPANVIAALGGQAPSSPEGIESGAPTEVSDPESSATPAASQPSTKRNAMDNRDGDSSQTKVIVGILLLLLLIAAAVWYAMSLSRKRKEQELQNLSKNLRKQKETAAQQNKVVATPAAKPAERPASKPAVKAPVAAAVAETPGVKVVEKIVEVPVEKIVEKIVEKRVEVPVEKIVEKRVEVPVEKIVEKIVEKRVEVPVEKIVEKIVEKRVEVPVEKVIEKPVEKIVNVDPNPEVLRQVESLRTILQQKQNELQEKEQQLIEARRMGNAALDDARKFAEQQMTQSLDAEKARSAAELANLRQQLEAAQNETRQKVATAEQLVAASKAAAEQQVAEVQQAADRQIAEAQQAAERKVAEAQRNAEQQIAALQQQLASAKADADKQIEAAKQALKAEADQQIEAAVADARQQADAAVAEAAQQAQATIEAAQAEANAAKAQTQQLIDQLQQPLQISRDGLQSSLLLIQEHVMLMREGVEAFNADNNYHNTTMHLSQKFNSFINWFDRNIMQGEASEANTVDGLYQLIQDSLRRDLENNYSWVVELLRLSSYSAISPLFLNEVKRSGIPVDSLKIAASETMALMGRYGITLVMPNLFVDDFERDNFKLNNAPLINSFYPQGFNEQQFAKRGVIYDMIRPGYAIGGQVQKVPEVSAMMAIAD